jgi:hypothetical protein
MRRFPHRLNFLTASSVWELNLEFGGEVLEDEVEDICYMVNEAVCKNIRWMQELEDKKYFYIYYTHLSYFDAIRLEYYDFLKDNFDKKDFKIETYLYDKVDTRKDYPQEERIYLHRIRFTEESYRSLFALHFVDENCNWHIGLNRPTKIYWAHDGGYLRHFNDSTFKRFINKFDIFYYGLGLLTRFIVSCLVSLGIAVTFYGFLEIAKELLKLVGLL